jgi:hypothetical protein
MSTALAAAAGLLVTTSWTWTGKRRRHRVTFEHSSLSGKQRLFINGARFFESGWRYHLTGCIYFVLDGSTVELYTRADSAGKLVYTCSVDSREVPPDGAGGGGGSGGGSSGPASPRRPGAGAGGGVSTWVVPLPDGLHQVELLHREVTVLVDGVVAEAAGDFVEGGASYTFTIARATGGEATAGTITAMHVPPDRRAALGGASLATTLVVEGVGEVPQSELLGAAAADAR